jgi:hypothetical protein
MITSAPSLRKRSAVAKPRPVVPPVISAIFPFNLLTLYFSFGTEGCGRWPLWCRSASNEIANAALFLASDESSYIRGPSTWSMVARPRPEVARYQPFAGAADCVIGAFVGGRVIRGSSRLVDSILYVPFDTRCTRRLSMSNGLLYLSIWN